MMFKNETTVVATKAERRYEELAKQKTEASTKKDHPLPSPESFSEGTINSAEDSEWLTLASTWTATSRSPQFQDIVPWQGYSTPDSLNLEFLSSIESIEDQAHGFFVQNYVQIPSLVPRGQFEWLTELLAQPNVDEVVRSSFDAVSLAALGNSRKSEAIMAKAQNAYVNALRMTNAALTRKDSAVKDSTLIAVILLGMYENMVFESKDSIQAWQKHVTGACAVIKMRGTEQLLSSVGRRIFHQFYGTVLLVALESGSEVNEGMQKLYEILTPTSDYAVHGRQWTTRLVGAMHEAINLNQDKIKNPVDAVNIALNLDRELDQIKALMPDVWNYETIYLESPPDYMFGNKYHIYTDPWIAIMWNNVRSCRMYLYKIIVENIEKGCNNYHPPLFNAAEIAPQREVAQRILRATAAGVIASVPQITGMIPFPVPPTPSEVAQVAATGVPIPKQQFLLQPPGSYNDRMRSSGMHHLIWPVFTAGGLAITSYQLRQWCIETLQLIALQIGTRQAIILAEELQQKQRANSISTASDQSESADLIFYPLALA